MADTVKSSSVLNWVAAFRDGDDRTFTIDDPDVDDPTDASEIASYATRIKAMGANIKANKTLVGDKAGAAFTHIKYDNIVNKTVTDLDLT